MLSLERARLAVLRGRGLILAAWGLSTLVWAATVADNYLVHLPYSWGHWCVACYNYYDGLYADVADPGLIAAAFFGASLTCLFLLWLPGLGAARAGLRAFLVVGPGLVVAFEGGAYFLLSYWWNIHATNFLAGTPFTNSVVFWTSAAVLAGGVTADLLARR